MMFSCPTNSSKLVLPAIWVLLRITASSGNCERTGELMTQKGRSPKSFKRSKLTGKRKPSSRRLMPGDLLRQ
ncbi:hypothetical protein D3C75_1375360 [compost metagenome]